MKSHSYMMYGSTRSDIALVLRPMTDDDIPTVQRWNQDPRAFYWRHQNPNFKPEHTRVLFNKLSADAYCFIIEANGKPIGETFLVTSSAPEMVARYAGYDVRCINVMIGERDYLRQGIGRAVIGMMTYFAFVWIGAEVINIAGIQSSSQSIIDAFVATGYKVCRKEPIASLEDQRVRMMVELEQSYREYIERHRKRIPKREVFTLSLEKLQPSQLYISRARLDFARKWFIPSQRDCMDACPVKKINNQWILLDGHVRATLADQAGWLAIPLYEHQQEIDLEPYLADVKLCEEAGVFNASELINRIVPHKEYEERWRKRVIERKTGSRYL